MTYQPEATLGRCGLHVVLCCELRSSGQLEVMQAGGDQQVGGVTQQDLAPGWQVGQGLSQLHQLTPVLHLLRHVVHLHRKAALSYAASVL